MENKYKFIAISRIKNSILTVSEFLYRLTSIVDGVIVLDNGSTDGTEKVYEYFKDFIIAIEHTEGFQEGRDKKLALETAKKYNPEWIIYLDSDEIIEYGVKRKDFEKMMNVSNIDVWKFRLFHFWNSKTTYRFDQEYKYYTLSYQARMWRNIPSLYMSDDVIHSGFIKGFNDKKAKETSIRLLHYGYIYKNQIASKYTLYTTVDHYTDKKYNHFLKEKFSHKTFIDSYQRLPNILIRFFYKLYYDLYAICFKILKHFK